MKSVWSESHNLKKHKVLNQNIKTENVVIGAGIAGILISYFLKQKGKDVVVIDSNKALSGNTLNTTAKITSQHNLIYSKLISEFGEEKAKHYAYANELAIKKYREIIKESNIGCDFEEVPAYVYCLSEKYIEQIKDEVKAAKKLGIDAEYTEQTDLPFKIEGAVKFNNQAQFNPIKFLENIAEDLVIYEDTKALEIKDNVVLTDKGDITAENIIVATHYPIMNVPGFYFMKMHQERSYVLALEGAAHIKGMYIDVDKKGYSFRNYNNLLLIGGEKHRTGENEQGGKYNKLRNAASRFFPESVEKYHWSAQDCMTLDGIPYIGQYSDETPNIYVATGFNKWGMTSSMVSAMIISDMICGTENSFSDIFSPKRFDLSCSIVNAAKDITETAKNFIAQKISIPDDTISSVENCHGGIVEYDGHKVGVYKNEEGECFIVTTKCPHLGCELQWNADDLTWECPCHGSRFDYKGRRLDGPAVRDNDIE